MIPAHTFSQIPIVFYRELLSSNREKAAAFCEYCADDFLDETKSIRTYALAWKVSKSSAERWIIDFVLEIEEFHKVFIRNTNQNHKKMTKKLQKSRGTLAGQKRDTCRTPNADKTSQNRVYEEEEGDTCGTETGQKRDGLTLFKKEEKEKGGGSAREDREEYLKLRLSGDEIRNSIALKKTIMSDLKIPNSDESNNFLEWRNFMNAWPKSLDNLYLDFAAFGQKNRKICREIAKDHENDFGVNITTMMFEIAFYESCKARQGKGVA